MPNSYVGLRRGHSDVSLRAVWYARAHLQAVQTARVEVFPRSLDFGRVLVGAKLRHATRVRNMDVDVCRFSVVLEQADNCCDIQLFYTPGTVRRVDLLVAAIAPTAFDPCPGYFRFSTSKCSSAQDGRQRT